MTLKERYENMSDEELLERYKNFQDYRDDAKEAMLEVLREKKLVGEEEIEKKLISIKNVKEDKEEFSVNKAKRNRNYSFDINNNISLSILGKLLMILLMCSSAVMVYSLLSFGYGLVTFSWNEAEGEIVNLRIEKRIVERKGEKKEITDYYFDYEYTVKEDKYLNNKASYGEFEESHQRNKIGKNHSEGDKIVVYYNPKNHKESVLFKYSLSKSLLVFIGSIIILLLFGIGILKYEEDYGEKISRKTIIIVFLISSLFFSVFETNNNLGTTLLALFVIGCIVHLVIESIKMYIIAHLK